MILDVGFATDAKASGRDHLYNIGPTMWVDVGFDEKFDYDNPTTGLALPESAAKQVPALIDTGATTSSIDDSLAQQLKLPLIDKGQASGVGGRIELNVYMAHINVPGMGMQYGRFSGVHLAAGGQAHRVLIGRSFLRDSVMVYDGITGAVRLCR